MKLLIGLGNPGAQYEQNRHNVGYHIVDRLAEAHQLRWERKGKAMISSGTIAHERVILVKPLTYMNNSGEAVHELLAWYKLSSEDILVIYDDLDLPVGQIRLRPKGSAGGHNGIKSIIQHLHSETFNRLRVGIGRPTETGRKVISHVLGNATGEERIQLEISEQNASEAVTLFLTEGMEAAMNQININAETLKKAEERRQKQAERHEKARQRRAAEQAEREQQQQSLAENSQASISTSAHNT